MKPILILAALAALLFVSPAEAKLFDRFRDRQKNVTVAVTVEPAVQTEAVTAPKLRRLRPLEKFKARLALNKKLRKARVAAE